MHRFQRPAAIWLLILGLAALTIYVPRQAEPKEPDGDAAGPSLQWDDESISPTTELRGRAMVMLQAMSGKAGGVRPEDLILGDEPLDRLASAILMINRGARDEAVELVGLAEEEFACDSVSQCNADLIGATLAVVHAWPADGEPAAGGQAAPPTEAQYELLCDRLGWFGEFAQAKITGDAELNDALRRGDAQFLLVLVAAGFWFLGVGGCGCIALVVLIIVALNARIRSGMVVRPGVSLILGETFVAWFSLFLGLQYAALLLDIDPESPGRLVLVGAMMFASLGSLWWVRLRGLSFDRLRDLVGWRWSGGFPRFVWQSCISYATALPLMGLGLLIGLAMGRIMDVPNLGNPSHPIQKMLGTADATELWLLFGLACVAAPIVEETVFRGLLYGHLRQGTAKWGVAASMLFSALISSALFAAIHPQGLFVAPALAGLACGFCITREWSGSVFPGMIAHGIQNATVLALNVLLFNS